MTVLIPVPTRAELKDAGRVLASDFPGLEEYRSASHTLSRWRGCHGYAMNTFQATLRGKLASGIDRDGLVAQRLKRAPSVIAKLQRFPTMKLHQMQDIAGLRAVVGTIPKLVKLKDSYTNSRFPHELVNLKDYVVEPKPDGYRSIHLVYKYRNDRVPQYDGLLVELQFRTKLQHAWATAVETMDTFYGQGLKAGQGEPRWAEFFQLASAVFSQIEKSPVLPMYSDMDGSDLVAALIKAERKLDVLTRITGITVAVENIEARGKGAGYHLIVLNSATRRLTLSAFSKADLERATSEYAAVEARARAGEKLEPVLVSAGSLKSLRKAYPNYFLDTREFVNQVQRILTGQTGLLV